MHITFKAGVTYTIAREYNGPERPVRYRNLSAANAKAVLRRLWHFGGGPLRRDILIITGSDGSERHIYP